MTKADIWVRALATTLAKKGIENGKEVTYTDAEVWVTLATEYASLVSTKNDKQSL